MRQAILFLQKKLINTIYQYNATIDFIQLISEAEIECKLSLLKMNSVSKWLNFSNDELKLKNPNFDKILNEHIALMDLLLA